jgi:FtsP/CotA-like multicopper oxidase with cupredoxin domain
VQILIALLLYLASNSYAKIVNYELTATQGKVNLSGKEEVDFALMLNGKIPAPTLEFTEGDEAVIVVKNRIPNQEVSIHWHGILLDPEMDGVPYVTTPPIYSGGDHTFRFKIRQHGTYWYHSHTNVQEQKGIYGAFVIHPKKKTIAYDRDVVVVISDWSDEDALSILKNLRKDGDYYLYKKNTMRSWLGAIQASSLGNFLYNEWTRMGGMDFSDVGYDAFLLNGKITSQLLNAKKGERVRIRLINASASSYFYISLGKEPMRIISSDGVDFEPVMAKEILSGMAETHDILFTVPDSKNYELRVTAQDGTGVTSGWIGNESGTKVNAPVKPFPDMYATMDHSGHHGMNHGEMNHGEMNHGEMNHGEHENGHHSMGHHEMKKDKVVETLMVDQMKAKEKTAFANSLPRTTYKLVLDGDMRRYIWHINGKAIFEDRNITVKPGEVFRFEYVNNTMMHHPFHLHGHFFRVLNENGDYSPMKHTVDVPPHGSRTIEFYTDEPGEWMLHCHNLYHLKTGMARVVKYISFTPKKEIAHFQHDDPHHHDHWYTYGNVEVSSNHSQALFRLQQTWNQFDLRLEARNTTGRFFVYGDAWEYEGDFFYNRWFAFDRFFKVIVGASTFDRQYFGVGGLGYTLPFLIDVHGLIDHRGKFRFELEKKFQWTKTIFTDADLTWRPNQGNEIGKDWEYEISLMYSPVWSWAVGLMFTDRDVGVGAHFQF